MRFVYEEWDFFFYPLSPPSVLLASYIQLSCAKTVYKLVHSVRCNNYYDEHLLA